MRNNNTWLLFYMPEGSKRMPRKKKKRLKKFLHSLGQLREQLHEGIISKDDFYKLSRLI